MTVADRRSPDRRTRDRRAVMLLLLVAAALPLTGAGVFAGALLALLVALRLVQVGDRVERWLVWFALAILVLCENLVFIYGFLQH